jgi:hypothetical protein
LNGKIHACHAVKYMALATSLRCTDRTYVLVESVNEADANLLIVSRNIFIDTNWAACLPEPLHQFLEC